MYSVEPLDGMEWNKYKWILLFFFFVAHCNARLSALLCYWCYCCCGLLAVLTHSILFTHCFSLVPSLLNCDAFFFTLTNKRLFVYSIPHSFTLIVVVRVFSRSLSLSLCIYILMIKCLHAMRRNERLNVWNY